MDQTNKSYDILILEMNPSKEVSKSAMVKRQASNLVLLHKKWNRVKC